MNKLLLLLAVVAAASAMPADSDLNLLKRLLVALQEEKRTTNYVGYSNNKLTVSYVARTNASGVSGHRAVVTDAAGNNVATFTEDRYSGSNGGGVSNTYDLSGLTSGATYTVQACEKKTDGTYDYCNTKTFTA